MATGVFEEGCYGLMEDGLQSGEGGREGGNGTSQGAVTPVLVNCDEGWDGLWRVMMGSESRSDVREIQREE